MPVEVPLEAAHAKDYLSWLLLRKHFHCCVAVSAGREVPGISERKAVGRCSTYLESPNRHSAMSHHATDRQTTIVTDHRPLD